MLQRQLRRTSSASASTRSSASHQKVGTHRYLWTWGCTMRFLDGPDEVHLGVVARRELAHARGRRGVTADYLVPPVPGGGARR
jgi:hypothetical protein